MCYFAAQYAAARTDSLFALGRIATLQGSIRTWYLPDALGSVRRTVSDVGVPLGVVNDEPWGILEAAPCANEPSRCTFLAGRLSDLSP